MINKTLAFVGVLSVFLGISIADPIDARGLIIQMVMIYGGFLVAYYFGVHKSS
jgi:hypothetical protein